MENNTTKDFLIKKGWACLSDNTCIHPTSLITYSSLEAGYKVAYKENLQNLKEKVFQALGSASMCWLPTTGNLEFNSSKAVEIGEDLWKEIEKAINEKVNS